MGEATEWGRSVVTKVDYRNNELIDGLPRHILDIWPVNAIGEEEKPSDEKDPRRSLRERRSSVWTEDYIMNLSLDQESVCLAGKRDGARVL